MNLAEAVLAKLDGKCEGFKRVGWVGESVLTLEGNVGQLIFTDGTPYFPYAVDFTADDYELVNPVPQYREEEVKAWQCPTCKRLYDYESVLVDGCCIRANNSRDLTLLTGTRKIEVKPPVKRRQQIEGTYAIHQGYDKTIPHNAKLFAEWEEQP